MRCDFQKNKLSGSYTAEKLSVFVIMLRGSTQTLPITTLYLGPIGDGAILNKTCGSILMLTRSRIMRYTDLILIETLALKRSMTEPCLVHQQV